jgi:hypothetical protein
MADLNAASAIPPVLPVNPDNATGLIAPHAQPGNAPQQATGLPQEVAPVIGGNRVGAPPDAGAPPPPVGLDFGPVPPAAQFGLQQGQPAMAPLAVPVPAAIPPPGINGTSSDSASRNQRWNSTPPAEPTAYKLRVFLP